MWECLGLLLVYSPCFQKPKLFCPRKNVPGWCSPPEGNGESHRIRSYHTGSWKQEKSVSLAKPFGGNLQAQPSAVDIKVRLWFPCVIRELHNPAVIHRNRNWEKEAGCNPRWVWGHWGRDQRWIPMCFYRKYADVEERFLPQYTKKTGTCWWLRRWLSQ